MFFNFQHKNCSLIRLVIMTATLASIGFFVCLNAQSGEQEPGLVAADGSGNLIRLLAHMETESSTGHARNPGMSILESRAADGLLLWEAELAHSAPLAVTDLKVFQSRVTMLGNFRGSLELNGFIFESGRNVQAFFAVFDLDGNLLWAGQVGGNANVLGQALVLDRFGMSMVGDFKGRGFRLVLPWEEPEHMASMFSAFDLDGNAENLLQFRATPLLPWSEADAHGPLDGEMLDYMPIVDSQDDNQDPEGGPPEPPTPPGTVLNPAEKESI